MCTANFVFGVLFCMQVSLDGASFKALQSFSYRDEDDNVETKNDVESDMKYQIVQPHVYHMARRRKRYAENGVALDELYPMTLMVVNLSGKIVYIELEANDDLTGINLETTFNSVDGNHFDDIIEDVRSKRCLLHGKVINIPGAVAAFSACSGQGIMEGIVLTPNGTYVLSPAQTSQKVDENSTESNNEEAFQKRQSDSPLHVLFKHDREDYYFCGVGDEQDRGSKHRIEIPQSELVDDDDDSDVASQSSLIRLKRADANNRKVIEVAVFVDSDLYSQIEASTDVDPKRATILRVLGIMNQVQLIYNYASLDTKFKLVIVKLQILKGGGDSPNKDGGNIDNYLDNFCNWQSKLNVPEGRPGHWDHAVMLTGLDLYKFDGFQKNNKVLGLAWVNGMCRSNYSCTLNEGTSFEAAFVIAHEMGHNLGIMHDGSGNNCDRNKFIMSEKTGPGKVNWSTCSNVYVKKFFRNGYGGCLEDDASPPNRSYDLQLRDLPGSRYTLTDQCILALGPDFKPHQDSKEPFNNVCRELWCASGSWAKPAHPALEGSPCATRKHCIQGSCRLERPSAGSISGNRNNSSSSSTSGRSSVQRRIGGTGGDEEKTNDGDIMNFIRRSVLKMIKSLG